MTHPESMLPKKLNLGSGKSFKPDHLNVDINAMWRPDICADMSMADLFGREFESERFGSFRIPAGHFDEITATDVLEHVPDLISLMTNCINLLRGGGVLRVLVPFDLSYGAWQDPTHVRAFNERSWLYYTDWHWYVGWRDTRFDLTELKFVLSDLGKKMLGEGVDQELICRTPRAVDAMQVTLTKRPLTEAERTAAERWLQGR